MVAGFIGYKLSKLLLEDGFKVLGIDNLNDYYYPRSKEARSAMERNYPCEIINFGNHKSENLMDIVGIIKNCLEIKAKLLSFNAAW